MVTTRCRLLQNGLLGSARHRSRGACSYKSTGSLVSALQRDSHIVSVRSSASTVTVELTRAMRKPVSTEACPHCSGEGHDSDAA
jgi:hypothetical protein